MFEVLESLFGDGLVGRAAIVCPLVSVELALPPLFYQGVRFAEILLPAGMDRWAQVPLSDAARQTAWVTL